MTPKEYIVEHSPAPLSPVELNQRNKVKVHGTDNFMPWDEVYTRIAAGMDMEHIIHIYGEGRKIALWAVHDNIAPDPVLANLLDDEITQRRKMQAVESESPTAAATIQTMANEYAPDAARNIAVFADRLVVKATSALDAKDKEGTSLITSLDMVNLTKAVQTASDILGHTQRHANAASLTQNTIQVEGFQFALDAPPDPASAEEAIEAEVS